MFLTKMGNIPAVALGAFGLVMFDTNSAGNSLSAVEVVIMFRTFTE